MILKKKIVQKLNYIMQNLIIKIFLFLNMLN